MSCGYIYCSLYACGDSDLDFYQSTIAQQFRTGITTNLTKIKYSEFSSTASQNELNVIPGNNIYVYHGEIFTG